MPDTLDIGSLQITSASLNGNGNSGRDAFEGSVHANDSQGISHRQDDMTAAIMSNPAEAMARLKHLHDTRVPLAEANSELHASMRALADFVWPPAESEGSGSMLRFEHPIVKELIKHGLFELVLDITESDYYEEGLDFVIGVTIVSTFLLILLRGLQFGHVPIDQIDNSKPLSYLQVKVDGITCSYLRKTWQARYLWGSDGVSASENSVRDARWIISYAIPQIHVTRLKLADRDLLRRIAGTLWMTATPDDHDDINIANRAFAAALSAFHAREYGGVKGVRPFVESQLCDAYGDLPVLKRFTGTYLAYRALGMNERRWLIHYTPWILNSARFYSHFKSTGVLAAVRSAYDYRMEEAESKNDRYMALETMNALAWTAYQVIQVAPFNDGIIQLVKQCEILEVLACFTVASAEHKRPLRPNECLPRDVVDVFTAMAGALHLRSGKNEFRKRFKLSLRREWYGTLRALRDMHDPGLQRDDLLEGWQALGDAMDLDETRERLEYEHELKHAADRRCSRTACEYHTKKPPKTRVCVGCNEARYCSRVCQRSDWKEGGHRTRCKRLKDVPVVFVELQDKAEERDETTDSIELRRPRRRQAR
ncbi:unnamed protein product [Peniophora sp. CBMAI 1063]|nr:unnamed protein product [Peniophora sp. CBMAI 1063]